MKAEVVLGHSYRLKATPPAGVEVIAVAKRAFGLRSWTLCGDRAAATTVSRQGVAQGVAGDFFFATQSLLGWAGLYSRPPPPPIRGLCIPPPQGPPRGARISCPLPP